MRGSSSPNKATTALASSITRKDFYLGVAIIVGALVSIEVSFRSRFSLNDDIEESYPLINVDNYRTLAISNGDNVSDYQSLLNELRNTIPIGIPPGKAVALPSIRVDNETAAAAVDSKRKIYGGKGDKKHLGGFTELDLEGVSPAVWKYMIQTLGVHSVLDVGCGRGTSTTWFLLHGCDVLCAEGSHDAVENSFLPDIANQVVEHDFSRGPWWPEKTYDAVWSVEFLEHVGVNYHYNYISSFRKAALIFVTSSVWGGT
jgi:Methyltransferase domain